MSARSRAARKRAGPTKAEVLLWINRHPEAGPAAAVDHFWPGADTETRSKLVERAKKWVQRERKKVAAKQAPSTPQADKREAPTPVTLTRSPTKAPIWELADQGDVETWRRHVALLEADLAQERADGVRRLVPQLTRAIADAREMLADALQRSRKRESELPTDDEIVAEVLQLPEHLRRRIALELVDLVGSSDVESRAPDSHA